MALLIRSPFECRSRRRDMVSPFRVLDALAYPEAVWDGMASHLEREAGQVRLIDEKKRFGVHMAVDRFRPEELTVRVADNHLVIEGKHEESDERGFISRNFSQRYLIPENVEKEKLQSRLVNGVLHVEAPKKPVVKEKPKEVTIPITFEK